MNRQNVQFKQVVPNLTRNEEFWVTRVLALDGADTQLRQEGIRINPHEANEWPAFQSEIQETRDLLIFSDHGNP